MRCASGCATATRSRRSPTTSTPNGTPNISCAPGRSRPSESLASKPAAARKIREDASINLAAVSDMEKKFPALDLVLIESGGDNLAATFSPALADLTVYMIDVA